MKVLPLFYIDSGVEKAYARRLPDSGMLMFGNRSRIADEYAFAWHNSALIPNKRTA